MWIFRYLCLESLDQQQVISCYGFRLTESRCIASFYWVATFVTVQDDELQPSRMLLDLLLVYSYLDTEYIYIHLHPISKEEKL